MRTIIWGALMVLLSGLLFSCAPSGRDVLIDYHRTGGIAGFDDRLLIRADGSATLRRRDGTCTFILPEATLADLRERLRAANFSALPSDAMPARPVYDGFTYTITYEGHTVRTADGGVPAGLLPVVQALNRLIDEAPCG